MSFVVPVMMMGQALDCDAAAVASGRNWRISIDRIECEAAASLVTIGMRIDYLGPSGPVEAPVSQLTDGQGRQYFPRSLVWRRGSKPLAQWLSAGGLTNLQSESIAEIQLKLDVRDASGDLQLEFGDIRAFPLTRKRTGTTCEGFLKPDQIQAPRRAGPAGVGDPKPGMRVYRNTYPCIQSQAPGTLRTTEAEYPPYLPRQLLVFGRGYLPSARQIELPMGKVAAQPYSYAGADELKAIEDAARRALAADFPEFAAAKYFAFNWGSQKSHSGNEVYSIGIYDIRSCPK